MLAERPLLARCRASAAPCIAGRVVGTRTSCSLKEANSERLEEEEEEAKAPNGEEKKKGKQSERKVFFFQRFFTLSTKRKKKGGPSLNYAAFFRIKQKAGDGNPHWNYKSKKLRCDLCL